MDRPGLFQFILTPLAAATALLLSPAVHAEEPAGDWGGLLFGRLHAVFHVRKLPDGRYEGSTESPDQGDAVIPADKVEATQDHLTITITKIGAAYEGSWDDKQKAWVGNLTQGRAVPLTLTRLDAAALAALKPVRPQDKAAAESRASFRPEQVRINNPTAPGVVLAGTYSRPMGPGPFPAVVLISGSGPQNRDEDVARHKIFLVLANDLNQRGIAVLRYDKRGLAGSTGDFAAATTADFASDAKAAVEYLATRADVDKRHIGLIGHSEGGAIAPMVAVESPQVSFVVLMAGPGLSGAEILLRQKALITKADGAAASEIAERTARDRKIFDAVISAKDQADAQLKIRAALGAQVTPQAAGEPDPAQTFTAPWMFYFLRYDPIPTLTRVRVPVLALGGSLDLQVPPEEDLAAIKQALKADKDVTVVELPGLNHLFQTAKTGSPAEYGSIQETISPVALKELGDWVEAHSR